MQEKIDGFILDLLAEAQNAESGVWVECDDPGLLWSGCRFRVVPNTTNKQTRLKRLLRNVKDTREIARITVREYLLEAEGIGWGDREATIDEVRDGLAQKPAFVAWLSEQVNRAATRTRETVETEAGN